MPRYRYCTPALTGPWRDSEAEALADAARAQQLRLDGDRPHWLVPGRVEVHPASPAAERH